MSETVYEDDSGSYQEYASPNYDSVNKAYFEVVELVRQGNLKEALLLIEGTQCLYDEFYEEITELMREVEDQNDEDAIWEFLQYMTGEDECDCQLEEIADMILSTYSFADPPNYFPAN